VLLLFVLMVLNDQENSYSPEICELQIWPEIILWKMKQVRNKSITLVCKESVYIANELTSKVRMVGEEHNQLTIGKLGI